MATDKKQSVLSSFLSLDYPHFTPPPLISFDKGNESNDCEVYEVEEV